MIDILCNVEFLRIQLLEIKKVDIKELKLLLSSRIVNISTYESVDKSTVAESFCDYKI